MENKVVKKQHTDDIDLMYEIILSKGLGYLTKKAEKMLLIVGREFMHKKHADYKSVDDRNDCVQEGYLNLYNKNKWMEFNERKYTKSLPYFTEVFKRGIQNGFNDLENKKKKDIKFISLDGSENNDRGIYNY